MLLPRVLENIRQALAARNAHAHAHRGATLFVRRAGLLQSVHPQSASETTSPGARERRKANGDEESPQDVTSSLTEKVFTRRRVEIKAGNAIFAVIVFYLLISRLSKATGF